MAPATRSRRCSDEDVAHAIQNGNGWTFESYTALTPGTYRIEAGVENVLDNNFSSEMGLDDVEVNVQTVEQTATPEPAALVIWSLLGAIGVSVRRWRPRKAA